MKKAHNLSIVIRMTERKFHPDVCVPLRESYEVFNGLKRTPLSIITKDGVEHGYSIVENPDIYDGFSIPSLWMGGAATKVDEWYIFVTNGVNSGWRSINTCMPTGLHLNVEKWREEHIEYLETFYGFHYRTGFQYSTQPRVE